VREDAFAEQLERARRGEAAGHRWLWARYAGPIKGFLLARGTPEVDEVVNDVFLAAFTRLADFEGGEADLRAWLHAIARNRRVDAIRGHDRRRRLVLAATAGRLVARDPDHAAITSLVDTELRELLEPLTPEQRDVVVLRFVCDLPLEEVAVVVDRPVGAVKALQHRALARLRKEVGAQPYPSGTSGAMS
jgi:RNA polymerase sigma-70 factor (ECF subfamily)